MSSANTMMNAACRLSKPSSKPHRWRRSSKTQPPRAVLKKANDEYVDSWSLSLMPEDANQFKYEYTVIRRSIITASAMVTRVE